jgi:hypothetical protein
MEPMLTFDGVTLTHVPLPPAPPDVVLVSEKIAGVGTPDTVAVTL